MKRTIFLILAVFLTVFALTGCRSGAGASGDTMEATVPELADSEVLALMLAQGYDIYNPRFSVMYNGRLIYGPMRAIEEKIAQSETAGDPEGCPEDLGEDISADIPDADNVPVSGNEDGFVPEDGNQDIVAYAEEYGLWDPSEDAESAMRPEPEETGEEEPVAGVPDSASGAWTDIPAAEEGLPAEEDDPVPVGTVDEVLSSPDETTPTSGDGIPEEEVLIAETSRPVAMPDVPPFTSRAPETVTVLPEGLVEEAREDVPPAPGIPAGETVRETQGGINWNIALGSIALAVLVVLIFCRKRSH